MEQKKHINLKTMGKRFNILMLGGPGSGKGTSGEYLSPRLNLKHLSTGESFRKHIKDETEIGMQVKDIIAGGGLVPDDISTKMTRSEMREYSGPNVPSNGFIFDGFPRNLEQGLLIDNLLIEEDLGELDVVIFLDAKDSTLLQRLKDRAISSGRPEDGDELYCKKRIEVYHTQTSPLIDIYRNMGILIEIPEYDTVAGLYGKLDEIIASLPIEEIE